MKFNKNPFSGSQHVPCGRTDMTKQMVVFLTVSKAP